MKPVGQYHCTVRGWQPLITSEVQIGRHLCAKRSEGTCLSSWYIIYRNLNSNTVNELISLSQPVPDA